MIRVLIADSRPARREQVRAMLAVQPDMEVAGQARDGQEAVQRAHALSPDLVLLAADLAVRDGFDTAELLAASGLPGRSVILSEGAGDDDLRRAMRVGARELLCWPLGGDALADALREVHADGLRRGTAGFAAEAARRGASARRLWPSIWPRRWRPRRASRRSCSTCTRSSATSPRS